MNAASRSCGGCGVALLPFRFTGSPLCCAIHTHSLRPPMTPHLPIFLCILSFLYPVFADPIHISLFRRSASKRSFSAIVAEAQRVQRKYYGNSFNGRHASKRAGVAGVQIIDQACAPLPLRSSFFLTLLTGAGLFLYCQRRDWHSVRGALLHAHYVNSLSDHRLCMLFWTPVLRTCGLPIASAPTVTLRPPYFKLVSQARYRPREDRTLACSLSTGRARFPGLSRKIPCPCLGSLFNSRFSVRFLYLSWDLSLISRNSYGRQCFTEFPSGICFRHHGSGLYLSC